jgi:hypothetical protein
LSLLSVGFLLTSFQEYLDAGADQYVSLHFYAVGAHPVPDSVLTKPVLEASLRSMLALADARKKTLTV